MQPLPRRTLPEQIAEQLRDELGAGRWNGVLPGVARLAREFVVAPATVRSALRRLEGEGLLTERGRGRGRGIAANAVGKAARPLRVGILRHDVRLEDNPQTSIVLVGIRQTLESAGHQVIFSRKSQLDLRHDVGRITRHLCETRVDAWIIEAGSYPLLEWCSKQPIPCLALYGISRDLPLARVGADKIPAYRAATRHLLSLGHRRIVLVIGKTHRQPDLWEGARVFLEEMHAHGVPTGSYNLPDWEEHPQGYNDLLESLFQRTPPTALIVDETTRFLATVAFCARHGIREPEDVLLVSTDCDAMMDWCHPGFAHMRWDNSLVVGRVARWVDAVRRGKPDRKIINFPAEFVPGAGIGPAGKA